MNEHIRLVNPTVNKLSNSKFKLTLSYFKVTLELIFLTRLIKELG